MRKRKLYTRRENVAIADGWLEFEGVRILNPVKDRIDRERRQRHLGAYRNQMKSIFLLLQESYQTFFPGLPETREGVSAAKVKIGAPRADSATDSSGEDVMEPTHFGYRYRKMKTKLSERKQLLETTILDLRHTLPRFNDDRFDALIPGQPPSIEFLVEERGFTMMQLAGEVHRAKEMFFAQLLNSCHVITAPRQHTHVTMQTTGYKVDSLPRSDKLSDGPKQPARRPSLDSLREAWVAGGSAKPGGIPPPRPERLTSISRGFSGTYITILPPIHRVIAAPGTKAARAEEIRRDTRRAAAMLIQRNWRNFVGFTALLARVKARKVRQEKAAEALAQAVEIDRQRVLNCFSCPDWARSLDRCRISQNEGSLPGASRHFGSTSKRWKHIIHTITMHPRFAMPPRDWRRLCHDVAVSSGLFKRFEPRRKPALRKSSRMLRQMYARYALAPEDMTLGWTPRSDTYWGLIDVEKFAAETHYEPREVLVQALGAIPRQRRYGGTHWLLEFDDFARNLMHLCCMNPLDLITYLIFVVGESENMMHVEASGTSTRPRKSDTAARDSLLGDNVPDENLDTHQISQGPPTKTFDAILCLLSRLHRGRRDYHDIKPEDFAEGASGFSWAEDLDDLSALTKLLTEHLLPMSGCTAGHLLKALVRYPILTWPSMNMQRKVRRQVFGEQFWSEYRATHTREDLPADLVELSIFLESENFHNMSLRHAWAATTKYRIFEAIGMEKKDVNRAGALVADTKTKGDLATNLRSHGKAKSYPAGRHGKAPKHKAEKRRRKGRKRGQGRKKVELEDDVRNSSIRKLQCVNYSNCGNVLDLENQSMMLCKLCCLKGIGAIANSVGSRAAARFRERAIWFNSQPGLDEVARAAKHHRWLWMEDRLTRGEFYYNIETGLTRWTCPEYIDDKSNIIDARRETETSKDEKSEQNQSKSK